MSLGTNIQFYRKKHSITQEELGERMEVSRQTLSKLESDVSFPAMEKLNTLCDMFDCNLDLLVRGNVSESYCEYKEEYENEMNKFAKYISLGVGIVLLGVSLFMLVSAFVTQEAYAIAVLLMFI